MAARKQFLKNIPTDPELTKLLDEARKTKVSEEELHEQRISFAYGNAPDSEFITKDSVRVAAKNIRLIA